MQVNVRDVGLIPGLGKSPGGGHENPLPDYCLEDPMDRGAWWATVHRAAESKGLKPFSTHEPVSIPVQFKPVLVKGQFQYTTQ